MSGSTANAFEVETETMAARADRPRPVDDNAGEPRLIGCFEAIAARQPGHPAVLTERGALTYGELNSEANRLAHLILGLKGAPGDRVALLLAPGPSLFAAMLAVLKAARICVILDPAEPEDRLRQVVLHSEPAIVLAERGTAELAETIAPEARIAPCESASPQPGVNPGLYIAPEEIAFLVYTSGSTGAPKAVMKSHGHVLLQPLTAGREMEVGAADRVLMLAALSGGQGVNTAWVALANGATLVAFPAAERGITGLAECIAGNAISVFVSSAALFRTFAKTIDPALSFPSVRVGTLAGDAATWADLRAFRDHFPNARMVTAFAASEAGYITLLSLGREAAAAEGPLPVGRPCAGRAVRIVEEDGNAAAPGTVGIVEVSGPHLASGYWREAALSERTFPTVDGRRVFRSSDLGLLAPDGSLILKGRADAAVKIRGHRVDIGEVEALLAELPGVGEAAAVVLPSVAGEATLAAFVVADGPEAPNERSLRTAARATMPRHLIPSAFFPIDRLPTTPNAKVDRGKLREMARMAPAGPAEPATTATEKMLAEAWAKAFDRDGIGSGDDFFALGGDSLIAAEIAARVFAETGAQLDLGAFFDAPVLRELAARIDAMRDAASGDDEPVVAVDRSQPVPLSLNQQFMWRISQPARQATRFNMGSLIELRGPLDRTAFGRALDHVVARHESLRTRFPLADGTAHQRIDPATRVELPYTDLSLEADPLSETNRILRERVKTRFDLAAAPPVRFALLKLGSERHALMRWNHHLISDAPSWNLLVRELAEAYGAFVAGKSPELPPLRFQYAEFAGWQRKAWRADGERYRRSMSWWKARAVEVSSGLPQRRLAIMRTKLAAVGHDEPVAWGLGPATTRQLDNLGAAEGATYYAVRLAALLPVLADLSGRETILFVAYFTQRSRAEFEGAFGLFVDSVPLLLRSEPDISFRELVRRVTRSIAETSVHAEMPFELIQAGLAKAGLSLPADPFRVHMPTQTPPVIAAGLEFRADSGVRAVNAGVQFWFDQVRENRSGCTVFFDGRIFDPDAIRELAVRIARFAEEAAEAPDETVAALLARCGPRVQTR
jgi:amino acid adenylation domain-containing protein